MGDQSIGRRKLLLGGAGVVAGGAGLAWWNRRALVERMMPILIGSNPDVVITAAPDSADVPCLTTTPLTEGPFYFPSPERVDITEGRPGRPFELRMQLTRPADCSPIANAVVEIWHCDAEGIYSGYPAEISHDAWKALVFFLGNAEKQADGEMYVERKESTEFMRGLQRTDADGWVTFRTVFPGWYIARVPHIHVRIASEEGELLTTQLFFDPGLCDRLYASTPVYDRFGTCPTTFETDAVLVDSGSAEGVLLNIPWLDEGPLAATARIGLQKG